MNPKPKSPLPGGEYTHGVDTGPQPVPSGVTVVRLIPGGDGGPGLPLPRAVMRRKRKRLLPTREEIATLPRLARAAFAERCARRVSPDSVAVPVYDTHDVGVIVTQAALHMLRDAFDPTDLTLIRRDFERLARLAKANGWTDDTPVPPDVFGPL